MARTNLSTIETDGPSVDMERGEDGSFSLESAFLAGAKQASLFVRDGRVYGQSDGFMFEVPCPADLESIMAFFAYSLVKHCEYRIAQSKGGDLNAETAKFVQKLGSWEPGRNASAAEAVYLSAVENTVRGLIVDSDGNPAGDDVKITETYLRQTKGPDGSIQLKIAGKGERDENGEIVSYRMQAVIDSVAKDQRAAFDSVVEAALDRGRNKPSEEKAEGKRGGRKARSMDLGIRLG